MFPPNIWSLDTVSVPILLAETVPLIIKALAAVKVFTQN